MSEVIYILSFQCDGCALVKIGRTRNFFERFKHHLTSFKGWELERIIPTDQPERLEKFLKQLLKAFSYNSSEEQFLIPLDELWFINTFPANDYAVPDAESLIGLSFDERWKLIWNNWGYHCDLMKIPKTVYRVFPRLALEMGGKHES
jgi:hypothetical protein